jgi:hypothetical protein
MTTNKEAAADILSLLEARLQRVDFLLNGDDHQDQTASTRPNGSAATRLRALERSLHSLANKSSTVSEVLALQKRYPELFNTSSPSVAPSTLPLESLASLVLVHSQLYQTTASQLTHLQEFKIPDPASAAKMIELQPRVEQARIKQVAQVKELAELRARSARVVEAWYEGGLLGMDDQWAEWEERLRDAEILVRRREAAKKREEGLV